MGLRVWLIRHGSTAWNEEGRHQGRIPGIGLSRKGVRETVVLARYLARCRVPLALLSSPQQRARQTAEIIREVAGWSVPVVIDERLDEWDIPIWEGRLLEEVAEKFPAEYACFVRNPHLLRLPGSEKLVDVMKRADEMIRMVIASHQEGDVAFVTHAAVIRTLVCRLLGIPLHCYRSIAVANASLTLVELDLIPIIHTLNWHPWALSRPDTKSTAGRC